MKQYDITDPQTVCKIGDTENDMKEGKNANCGFIVGVFLIPDARTFLKMYTARLCRITMASAPLSADLGTVQRVARLTAKAKRDGPALRGGVSSHHVCSVPP